MIDEAAEDGLVELPAEVLGTPARPLPAFARIGSVEVAIVAKADLHELVMLRAKHAMDKARELAKAASRVVPAGLSTIERDAEVADFLRERFRGRMTLDALHVACVERFGAERARSRSRICTFRSRWRATR